jgi:hypothetical protein
MKKLAKTLLVILCLAHGSVFGQELKKSELTNDWTLLSESNGVKLFVKSENCQVQGAPKTFDYLFIKLENTNLESKKVDLQLGMNFNEMCIGCSANSTESKREIIVPANSTVMGDATLQRGELSYLIANHNATVYTFKSVKLVHLNIQ